MKRRNYTVISFSGIDGAGKSTQIDALLRYLQERGHRVRQYAFWDNVVAFSRYRESLSLRVFKGEKGVGTPERPIARRDKNVTAWYVTVLRLFLYWLDAFRLLAVTSQCETEDSGFVIFDRYIYDELANLPLQYWPVRLYVRLLLLMVPKPNVAILLDAEPETAISRKPEYPLEFVRRNREAYLIIANLADMCVISPSSVAEMTDCIREAFAKLQGSVQGTALRATDQFVGNPGTSSS
jgi:thymidylate kinase